MNICVIGSGYVGLVTAAGFAEFGNTVVAIDRDQGKIDLLKKGKIPFFEPGLSDLVLKNQSSGRLSFSTDLISNLTSCSIIFIAVGTPPSPDGSCDLTALNSVCQTLIENLDRSEDKLIVIKSTVPVGTGDDIRSEFRKISDKIRVANNPEFLREGTAVEDFLRPDRVVIGVSDKWSEEILTRLYQPVSGSGPTISMSSASAELTKYASNAMLATRISFMNEIANLSEKVGADIDSIRRGMGLDPRIGSKYLYAGPGYGGSCFGKDISSLLHVASKNGSELRLCASTQDVNERQKLIPVKKAETLIGELKGKTVCVWGLSFKPYTDDIRDSAALVTLDELINKGANIQVHDPEAMENIKKMYGTTISYFKDHYRAAKGSDVIILMTEWREYRNPDYLYLKTLVRNQVIIDSRNVLNEREAREAGFVYACIGRSSRTLMINRNKET